MPAFLVDIFAGCGGATLGFKAAGFVPIAAVELDPAAEETYRINHTGAVLFRADVRRVSPENVMAWCGLKRGELALLVSCPPCQPFSRLGRKKEGEGDERALLVLETTRFASALYPAFIFFENVPGLSKSALWDELLGGLAGLGYHTVHRVVDAVNYGVPQFRKRLILIGTRLPIYIHFPPPTHAPPNRADGIRLRRWLTVWDAFEGLEEGSDDPMHRPARHRSIALERLRHIPRNGGSRDVLPPELRLLCHRERGYHDVYGRLSFDRPANTLTSGCTDITKGRFAHPVFDRAITLREAARLQTFPDDYRFCGNKRQIAAQIGNAVPPRLAEVFGNYFRRLWEECTGGHE